eukprot:gnl/MRDRNA2_/MRDRNA2_107419_c0_seq1.p1 gnl/MRDRNA2_/MRDRNA2_107419_c0~~gnl/MRDRNA2_/MRDRNA2_107419_c0_seq1.p1  ORF type:complete len:130 (+),score=27.82 gnl/MRDRNA2_/MRDRNA2_107419_c0_seq1:70-459(+)
MMLRNFKPILRTPALRGPSNRFFSALTDKVDAMIKEHPVFLVCKMTCPSCNMAKDILKKEKVEVKNVNIDEVYSRDEVAEIQGHMQKVTGARTVPRVFIGGKCIGGGDDLAMLAARGGLKPLLQKATAG